MTKASQILGATVNNLVTAMTLFPRFVHPGADNDNNDNNNNNNNNNNKLHNSIKDNTSG
jgi:hypothetical protein